MSRYPGQTEGYSPGYGSRSRSRSRSTRSRTRSESRSESGIHVRVELTRGLGSGSTFGLECMASGLNLSRIRSPDPGRSLGKIKVKYSSSRLVTVKYHA